MNWNKKVEWFNTFIALLEAQGAGAEVIPRIPRKEYQEQGEEGQKQLLRRHMQKVLERSGFIYRNKKEICFAHEERTPSLHFNADRNNFHCFGACSKSWDIFEIVGAHYGLDKFPFKKAKVEELFVEQVAKPKLPSKGYRPVLTDPEIVALLKGRGITEKSMLRFGLKAWNYEADGAISKYVVIPCAGGCMVRKKLISGSKDHHEVSIQKGKKLTLFNEARLSVRGMVIVVESALDAILLEQYGFTAVALNGLGKTRLKTVLENQPVPAGLHLVLLLDNDHAGSKTSLSLVEELQNLGVSVSRYDYQAPKHLPQSFLNGFKDVGNAMKESVGATLSAITVLVEKP